MEVSKRWVVICFLIVVLLVSLFGGDVSFDKIGITGNVVVHSPASCEQSELEAVWDDIFAEPSSGAVFFDNGSVVNGACSSFLGYKIDGNRTWGIVYRNKVGSYGDITETYWSSRSTLFPVWVSNISAISEYNGSNVELMTLVLNDPSTTQERWFTLNIDDIPATFSSVFSVEDGVWVEKSSYFEFQEEALSDDLREETYGLVFFDIESSSYSHASFNTSNYNPPAAPILITNVSNFVFEQNSSWNFAFSFDNHFDYPLDAEFYVDFSGDINNTDGEWINGSVDVDEVLFMPADNFLGTRRIRVRVLASTGVVYSNYFNVSIVVNVNEAPVLERNFGTLSLVGDDNLTVNLKSYFSDPDGDNLTYRTSDLSNVVVGFSGDNMDVSLGENFSSYERFRVYASDDEFEASSNYISVIEGVANGSSFTAVNDSFNSSVDSSDSAPGNDSAGGESQQDEGVALWVWIVLGVVAFLVIVGVVLYFVFFSGGPAAPVGGVISAPVSPGGPAVGVGGQPAQPVSENPVNDYLTNLNLPKK